MHCHNRTVCCIFFVNCTCIVIPSQEWYKHHSNTCPTIRFNVKKLVSLCAVHVRHKPEKKDTFVVFYSATNRTKRKTIHTEGSFNDRDIDLWI